SSDMTIHTFEFVMAGLVPAIHAFASNKQGADARHKAGHDVDGLSVNPAK
ncbi:MAG: hypothetical protein QOF91_3529, partial [Alphaproteobacteria bacterium]|nr:hypothetical protein [Alphaproteobacteria bacterium]